MFQLSAEDTVCKKKIPDNQINIVWDSQSYA